MIDFLFILKSIFCSKYSRFVNELRKIFPDARVDDESQSIIIGKYLILYDDRYFYVEPIGKSQYYEIEHKYIRPETMAILAKNIMETIDA